MQTGCGNIIFAGNTSSTLANPLAGTWPVSNQQFHFDRSFFSFTEVVVHSERVECTQVRLLLVWYRSLLQWMWNIALFAAYYEVLMLTFKVMTQASLILTPEVTLTHENFMMKYSAMDFQCWNCFQGKCFTLA